MGIQAKLILDSGEEFNILECHYSTRQDTYKSARPSGMPELNLVHVVLESRKDQPFFNWATQFDEVKQCEIHFLPRILGSTSTRKVYLIDAICVSYKVNFTGSGDNPMTDVLELSCGGLKTSDDEAEYSAHWRKTFPQEAGEEETVIEEENPKINESYFESKKGEKITGDLRHNQEVYFVIKTKDMVGKTVDVDLSDSEIDFEYNGTIVENDMLKAVSITSDLMKLKLKALRPTKTK